jgi:hypothetical protein
MIYNKIALIIGVVITITLSNDLPAMEKETKRQKVAEIPKNLRNSWSKPLKGMIAKK